MIKFDYQRFRGLLTALTEPGRLPGGGYTRLAFGPEERAAHTRLLEVFRAKPFFKTWQDAIGNSFVMKPGSDPSLPPLLLGSHLDTVPNGGEWDGALGIAAGAELLLALSEADIALTRSVILVAFVGEESSRFSMSCIGSRWFTGCLDVEEFLHRRDVSSGRLAVDVLTEAGINTRDLYTPNSFDGPFEGYLELHISQGLIPTAGAGTVGIVDAIAAPERLEVTIVGTSAHSGTCPMRLRQDAVVAAATLVLAVKAAADAEEHDSAVATVGVLDVPNGSMNVVPGTAVLNIDIRDVDSKRRQRVRERIDHAIAQIEATGVKVVVRPIQKSEPVFLSDSFAHLAKVLAERLKIPVVRMGSGAGHDAMFLPALGLKALLLFVASVDGKSHHPEEFSHDVDVEPGLRLLLALVCEIAS